MLLNGIRARLESAVDARRAAIENEELGAALRAELVRRHAARRNAAAGRLHILTQVKREIEDVFLGMGFEVYEGDEVTDTWHNFDAHDRSGPSVALADRHVLSQRRRAAADAHVAGPDPPDGVAAAADLRDHARPLLPPRHAGRDALADVPAGREPRRRPRDHARRI